MRNTYGFTIVELMISMVLGMLVVASALVLFGGQRMAMRLSSQSTEVQHEGRIALDALARDLRAAGDFGCWPVSSPINVLNTPTAFNENGGGVRGFAKTDSLAAHLGGNAVAAANPDSDIVAVTGIVSVLSELASGMATHTDTLLVKAVSPGFKANDVAVISDCINWTKFQITAVATKPAGIELSHAAVGLGNTVGGGNKQADLGELYGVGASVGRLDTNWWFVGQPNGKPRGLYRMSATEQVPLLISPDVTDLRLRYEVDTSTPADKTPDVSGKTATEVSALARWPNITAVSIELLARSSKPVGRTSTYRFGGQSVTANDGYAYQSFGMEVGVRNP